VRRLTLVRHGQADWKGTSFPDFERPLNRRGVAEASAIGRRLNERGLRPDLIVTSPAVRTSQTAEALARELGVGARLVRRLEPLYLAPAEELLRVVAETGPRISHLLIVGHNPGLTDLARRLAPDAKFGELATGSCCDLTFERDDWAIGPGTARTAEYESPRRAFELW